MSNMFMTKDRMREHIENISMLAHFLDAFLNCEDDGIFQEAFDTKLPTDPEDGKKVTPAEKMGRNVVSGDMFVFELIPFLKSQSEAYISYFKQELLPEPMKLIDDAMQHDGIEQRIFRYRDSDLMHDIYLVLKAARKVFADIDVLIASDDDALDDYLDYRISCLGYANDDEVKASRVAMHNAFTWHGTPAELACLMDTLHEKGYIEAPQRANGERNNEGFNKMIGAHFRLADGSEKSVLNNLKDSRITPDNQFKIAMDKLPKKR